MFSLKSHFLLPAAPNVVCRNPKVYETCSCADGWESSSADQPTNCKGKSNNEYIVLFFQNFMGTILLGICI